MNPIIAIGRRADQRRQLRFDKARRRFSGRFGTVMFGAAALAGRRSFLLGGFLGPCRLAAYAGLGHLGTPLFVALADRGHGAAGGGAGRTALNCPIAVVLVGILIMRFDQQPVVAFFVAAATAHAD